MGTQRASLWWPASHTISKGEKLEIVFEDRVVGDADNTTVTITQTGFERLGDAGAVRKERTELAWEAIGNLFVDSIARG